MTTIYLVRHGETDENSKNIIQGRKNTHLNTKGVQKTKELRQTIISLGVDICYTSPLLRTLETAFGLVADKALIIKDDRLLERNMGIFDDKNIKEYNPEKYWDYNLNSSDDGVECLTDLFERCQNFLDDVIPKNRDKKILIVSHASVIRCMHHILRNTDLNKEKLHIPIPNSYFEVVKIPKSIAT